ncbi:hypothetical protein KSF78_0007715 [Schistosoma japonicum]|nr:hypothetical protein KSF78_0007715 [Schistosoma japonicum]
MNSISCFHFLLAYKLTGADTVSDVKSIGSIGVNCFVRLVNRSDLDCFLINVMWLNVCLGVATNSRCGYEENKIDETNRQLYVCPILQTLNFFKHPNPYLISNQLK